MNEKCLATNRTKAHDQRTSQVPGEKRENMCGEKTSKEA